jgi:hypothetical protein
MESKTNNDMKELRLKLYDQIEALEEKLKGFDTDNYGNSTDESNMSIRDQMDDLSRQISATWVR